MEWNPEDLPEQLKEAKEHGVPEWEVRSWFRPWPKGKPMELGMIEPPPHVGYGSCDYFVELGTYLLDPHGPWGRTNMDEPLESWVARHLHLKEARKDFTAYDRYKPNDHYELSAGYQLMHTFVITAIGEKWLLRHPSKELADIVQVQESEDPSSIVLAGRGFVLSEKNDPHFYLTDFLTCQKETGLRLREPKDRARHHKATGVLLKRMYDGFLSDNLLPTVFLDELDVPYAFCDGTRLVLSRHLCDADQDFWPGGEYAREHGFAGRDY